MKGNLGDGGPSAKAVNIFECNSFPDSNKRKKPRQPVLQPVIKCGKIQKNLYDFFLMIIHGDGESILFKKFRVESQTGIEKLAVKK